MTKHIALFMTPSRVGGGVTKSMLSLASAFAERGHRVDLVLSRAEGPYLQQVPSSVKIVALKAASGGLRRLRTLSVDYHGFRALLMSLLLVRKFRYLPDLVQYLQQERPSVLLSAKTYPNLAALWARRLAGTPTRVVVSERTNLSQEITLHSQERYWLWQFLPLMIRRVYPWADAIVAVSNGVADDLSRTTGLPRKRIATIYNPVVTSELQALSHASLDHPWFAPDSPPVVLGAGRLEAQKDFPTLIKAFARVQAAREARLVILGEGKDRAVLEALARELGVASHVDLPGFVANPFPYMACANVFVLSSVYEGLPGVSIHGRTPLLQCPQAWRTMSHASRDCRESTSELLRIRF
ncbi:MAG: glycosyltransferase [Candidatus Binatia bacterium]